MIDRETWIETLDKCKEDYHIIKREADLWEKEAKRLLEENRICKVVTTQRHVQLR